MKTTLVLVVVLQAAECYAQGTIKWCIAEWSGGVLPGVDIVATSASSQVRAVTEVSAPDKPDFSGTWILQSPPDGGRGAASLSITQTLSHTNVRGEPVKPHYKEITITRRSGAGTQTETLQIGVVGGAVPGEPNTGGDVATCRRVAWEDDALVVESGRCNGVASGVDAGPERREVWSLDPNGLLHITITTRGPGGGTNTASVAYRRGTRQEVEPGPD